MVKEALVFFEDYEIRKIDKDGQVWISALDVARALEYENPSATTANTIKENKERFEGYLTIQKICSGQQKRNITFLNLKGVIAFCMLSKKEKAIPFQRWADKVLEKEIMNIPKDIKLEVKRKRVAFTDTLKEHGYTKAHEYIQTTKQMKHKLNIEKKKEDCDLIELMKIASSEMLAKTQILINNANGYQEVNPLCVNSSEVINQVTRKQIQ